jgi:hypothetical protein
MPARWREVEGRQFVHLDDYLAWNERRVPGTLLRKEHREEGIVVGRWNDWVREYSTKGRLNPYGTFISTVEHWSLRSGEGIRVLPSAEDAESALAERTEAFTQLCEVGLSKVAETTENHLLSDRQQNILEALKDGPMRTGKLTKRVGYFRRTLFKPRGLKELVKMGFVTHDKSRGYSLTQAGQAHLTTKPSV